MTDETLFARAIAISDPAERAAFLDRECADPDQRREVEELLAAHSAAGSFLTKPDLTAALGNDSPPPELKAVGPYKLLQKIGEGGMGTVYMAEQEEPVRRRVAVKIIKAGMDSDRVIARFEAERQALALMDHPNIAKVLDAGTTPDGRPYFVMELVKGVPITKFCDDNKLTPRERLELFIPVCHAIQHAHQKGIIHRDIKPSNVLVTLYDGKPVPKVIDFGVAKATQQRLTERTLFTEFGALIGTPEYMSPEQAEMNALDIDTRSDVYALGVLLYELLTGFTPIDRKSIRDAGYLEMLRLIREVEPPRPSARISGSREAAATISEQRKTDAGKLSKLMKGELDWIVMKALEKDRNRRYESAASFAKDVERYLKDEMVEARPPTLGYRLRKSLRKNRAGVLLVLFVAACALALVTNHLITAHNVRVERDRAVVAEQDAARDRDAALQSQSEAIRERKAAERTAASLQIDLDMAEYDRDPRTSLLRLARTMRRLPDHCREYREFASVAILAGGQQYAPLTPPLGHDGVPVREELLSPDCRTLFTVGQDGSARLWNTLTGQRVLSLRTGPDEIASFGFSPDSRWLFTDDWNGVIRVWNTTDGTLRCQTAPRPDRYQIHGQPGDYRSPGSEYRPHPLPVQLSGDRLLTLRVGIQRGSMRPLREPSHGPVELWDATTGRRIAQLSPPTSATDVFTHEGGFIRDSDVCFGGNGKWVFIRQDRRTTGVFSAADGKLLTRLAHPNCESIVPVAVNPDATRLLTMCRNNRDQHFRVWETERWTAEPVALSTGDYYNPTKHKVFYLTADTFAVVDYGTRIMKHGRAEPVAQFRTVPRESTQVGELAWLGEDVIYNARTAEQIVLPQDRRFHPELARFAPDGRFVVQREEYVVDERLLDIVVDKVVVPARAPLKYVPQFGFLAARWDGWDVRIHRIAQVNIPSELLELWLQVAVRGELGPNGRFAEWDEATWNRKRQELAAQPRPVPDFPFPGQVVTNDFHWLAEKYESSDVGREWQLPLLDELVRRAEQRGDPVLIAQWRYELEEHRCYRDPTAPPPREVKKP